jgi:hypothetical protein
MRLGATGGLGDMFRFARIAAAAVAALSTACLASSPAGAHGIVIDNQGSWQPLGNGCNPCSLTLDFAINAGSGPTTQIYVYNTGLISIGSPFSSQPSLDPNNIAANPTNFLSLLYTKDPAFAPMYANYYFTPTEDDIFFMVPGPGNYPQLADPSNPTPVAIELTPNSGNPGAFTADWAFESNSPPYYPGLPDDMANGYPLSGYQFGSNINYYPFGITEDVASFNYPYSGPVSGAPEPSTWIELIAGVLALGVLLRRRPGAEAATA